MNNTPENTDEHFCFEKVKRRICRLESISTFNIYESIFCFKTYKKSNIHKICFFDDMQMYFIGRYFTNFLG